MRRTPLTSVTPCRCAGGVNWPWSKHQLGCGFEEAEASYFLLEEVLKLVSRHGMLFQRVEGRVLVTLPC